MKNQKFLFIIGFLREIFHTTFFVYFAIFLLPGEVVWIRQNIALILILAAGYLIIPACYLFLFYDDNKFYAIIQLLRITKILRILILFLIILREFINSNLLLQIFSGLTLNTLIFYIMLIILFFDLIFLYFLLSYKVGGNQGIISDTSMAESGKIGNIVVKSNITDAEVWEEVKKRR